MSSNQLHQLQPHPPEGSFTALIRPAHVQPNRAIKGEGSKPTAHATPLPSKGQQNVAGAWPGSLSFPVVPDTDQDHSRYSTEYLPAGKRAKKNPSHTHIYKLDSQTQLTCVAFRERYPFNPLGWYRRQWPRSLQQQFRALYKRCLSSLTSSLKSSVSPPK